MFEKVLEIMKLINGVMSAYFGDINMSIWHKQYRIDIGINRKLHNKVAIQATVHNEGAVVFIGCQDDAGTWSNNNTWGIAPSKTASLIEAAVKSCK